MCCTYECRCQCCATGEEFDVVKRILVTGLHKKIDVMAVEWHHTNSQVLGNKLEKYQPQYDSMQWFLKDTNVQLVDWGRRRL